MCRLFGFRSVIPSQVHRSLVAAENALGSQSARHPDGWGVAYYVDDAPHVMKSPTLALGDHLFHHLSGVVSSESVVAHVRRATVGGSSILNTHPFQHGRWVFAHNGEISDFERCRARLTREVAPRLRRFILGETDSEVIFFLFLTVLSGYGPLASRLSAEEVQAALATAVVWVRSLCDDGASKPSLLNLLVTNGATMVAVREGKELFWSTHKVRCSDRDRCAHLSPECEAPTETGFVNHLIVSSEPLQGENVWNEMFDGEIVGVDSRMRITRTKVADAARPV
ncbi:MAG: class II glutamine amidotransferase [Deltaproteobacteria bacterium]|nr:class II glutamine amidotransferase [Deltaproteobacteria bacterium]